VDKHIAKMHLDYWRYKLQTFTTKEYKAGWRNSQLRDTQTITKYALPFLKTVFSKVDVQKGEITAQFRKIYKVQPRQEKKERSKHSHHAIDAAVLTLIPPAATRDKILERFNEANDKKQGYHEKPKQWDKFHQNQILRIEDEVLINYQAQHRTLTPTYKNERKRGQLQFVKEKIPNGKWQYKLDTEGKKIPLVANGDSIRGELHKKSFFGAIKNKGELNLVERYPIASFTSINDCKNIVDDAVKTIVKDELEKRMTEGMSFDNAKLEPITFPSGKAVIKKVRCKVLAGAGYLRYEKAEKIQTHNFVNPKHPYKHTIYAQNNEMTYLLYYEKLIENKVYRAFRIVGLFELSQLNLKNENELLLENYYKTITTGKGKNEKILDNPIIIKNGIRCIFYKETIDELKEIYRENNSEILKRTFAVYKYNTETTTNFIYLKNHIEARAEKEIKEKEYRNLDFNIYQSRLQFTADKFTCAIEGKHFTIAIDGTINWINTD
jgi:CRISPR-associated endonuclease Csn1